MVKNTLDQIIADLEKTASAPVVAAEPVVAAVETPETPVVENNEELAMQEKVAELDAEGRIIARGFMDEIQKIAVSVVGMTPNTGAVPANPAIQVATSDAHEADVQKVESLIKKLTLGGEAKVNPAGVIHENNMPVAATQPIAVDEHPLAADVNKTAGEEILEALYQKWFTN